MPTQTTSMPTRTTSISTRLRIVRDATSGISDWTVEVPRVPVRGEYVRQGDEWFQVKRVCHLADGPEVGAEIYAVPIVDPTREPVRLFEWLEAEPTA